MDALSYAVALVLALMASYVVIVKSDPDVGLWIGTLRSRLLFGVPWGTLVVAGGVIFVYLFIQDGRTDLYRPVTIPFRSWSYGYPTGWIFSGFAHNDFSHLRGNITAALVLGSIAEFAFGHYPNSEHQSDRDPLGNPYVRAFVIFPGVVIGIGLLTGLFALGPVIGFSGVVFAFAGFALIRYPLSTVLALFVVRAIRRMHDAWRSPTVQAGIEAPLPSAPWWSEIAIQGHALGLLIGVTLGMLFVRRYQCQPSAGRLWLGVFLFAMFQSLWAVYWFEGHDQYLLLQGLGVVLVVALALLITAAISKPDISLRVIGSIGTAAAIVLVLALAMIAGMAIPANLVGPDPAPATEHPGVEIEDYRVIYAEDVRNEMVVLFDINIGGLSDVRTSGVIVASEERGIWTRVISANRLKERGSGVVTVGGVAWRETVLVQRENWNVVGNDSIYQIWLSHDDDRIQAFTSPPKRPDVTIANRSFELAFTDERPHVTVFYEGEPVDEGFVPKVNESIILDDITLTRENGKLRAGYDGTNVTIASRGR